MPTIISCNLYTVWRPESGLDLTQKLALCKTHGQKRIVMGMSMQFRFDVESRKTTRLLENSIGQYV